MTRLAHNISANLLSNVWSTALALLLTPLYVKLLGVESYGLIGFYASWVAVIGILDTGISATATRQIAWLAARPVERHTIPSLVRTLEVVYWSGIAVIGVGMMVAAWRFGPEWFHSQQLSAASIRDALMLMAVSLIVQVPSGLYVGALMGLQRQVECAALVALFGTIRSVGALAVIWFIRPDIRVFFLWQIGAAAFQTAVIRQFLWHGLPPDPAVFSKSVLRSVRGFAGGMMVVTALSVVLAQADKIMLPRFVPLEVLGFYMLAWTVASGLSRAATPLIQAFGPRFTELYSSGDERGLVSHVRTASRLMSGLILPPAAVLMLSPEPVLLAWTGNAAVAAGTAPLLSVLVVGTVLSVSAYPALSVLFARNRMRLVVIVSISIVAAVVPLLALAIMRFGAIGAAACWSLSGLIMFLAYGIGSLQGLPDARIGRAMGRDFVAPLIVSVAVAFAARHWFTVATGRIHIALLLAGVLALGWSMTFLVSAGGFNRTLISKWKTVLVP